MVPTMADDRSPLLLRYMPASSDSADDRSSLLVWNKAASNDSDPPAAKPKFDDGCSDRSSISISILVSRPANMESAAPSGELAREEGRNRGAETTAIMIGREEELRCVAVW